MKNRTVFFLLACVASGANASCLAPAVSAPNDPSAFVRAYTGALLQLDETEKAATSVQAAKTPEELFGLIDDMTDSAQCANAYTKPFAVAKEDGVRTASQGMQLLSGELTQLNEQTKARLVGMMNGDLKEKAGDKALRTAAMTRSYREAWSDLATTTQAAGIGLIEFESPDSKKGGRLRLTATQRRTLTLELVKAFPSVTGPQTKAQTHAALSAYVLYTLLVSKWASHDQPFPAQPPEPDGT